MRTASYGHCNRLLVPLHTSENCGRATTADSPDADTASTVLLIPPTRTIDASDMHGTLVAPSVDIGQTMTTSAAPLTVSCGPAPASTPDDEPDGLPARAAAVDSSRSACGSAFAPMSSRVPASRFRSSCSNRRCDASLEPANADSSRDFLPSRAAADPGAGVSSVAPSADLPQTASGRLVMMSAGSGQRIARAYSGIPTASGWL